MDLKLGSLVPEIKVSRADTTKSLYYVLGLDLIFWSFATMYNNIFHSLLEPEQLRWL